MQPISEFLTTMTGLFNWDKGTLVSMLIQQEYINVLNNK